MMPILNQLYCLLLVFGSAAFLFIGFRYCKMGWANHQAHRAGLGVGHEPTSAFVATRVEARDIEANRPAVELMIPAHKFRKEKGVGLAQEEYGMCAVCLCDYEEGEALRTLPECRHSFHVPCIDMWLYSHSTCPVCRVLVPCPHHYKHVHPSGDTITH